MNSGSIAERGVADFISELPIPVSLQPCRQAAETNVYMSLNCCVSGHLLLMKAIFVIQCYVADLQITQLVRRAVLLLQPSCGRTSSPLSGVTSSTVLIAKTVAALVSKT